MVKCTNCRTSIQPVAADEYKVALWCLAAAAAVWVADWLIDLVR